MSEEEFARRYRDERNEDLARELGVSVRTVARWARKLGVEKSAAFMREASRRGLDEIAYRHAVGQKMRVGRTGSRTSFKPGHKWDAETEKKRVKALRDSAWEERVRRLRGWERKKGWIFKEK